MENQMARGWESKSVEMQIEATQSRLSGVLGEGRSAQEIVLIREKESLRLSRIRVVRELETSKNPRYLQLLTLELKALDAKIGKLN
jgi:hypothetical protein